VLPGLGKTLLLGLIAVSPAIANATYSCTGQIAFLGIDGGGDLTIQLLNSTPTHKICNVNSQGPFTNFTVASCKIAYASALAARLSTRTLTIFYNDNLTCASQPFWGESFGAYFVQGPD
jgi:hypothetical protein